MKLTWIRTSKREMNYDILKFADLGAKMQITRALYQLVSL